MCHELKCYPIYFAPLSNGTKTFEVQKKDRLFKVGDILAINEYIPESVDPYEDIERGKTDDWRKDKDGYYTGKHLLRKIVYILDEEEFCAPGTVILGLSALL